MQLLSFQPLLSPLVCDPQTPATDSPVMRQRKHTSRRKLQLKCCELYRLFLYYSTYFSAKKTTKAENTGISVFTAPWGFIHVTR